MTASDQSANAVDELGEQTLRKVCRRIIISWGIFAAAMVIVQGERSFYAIRYLVEADAVLAMVALTVAAMGIYSAIAPSSPGVSR